MAKKDYEVSTPDFNKIINGTSITGDVKTIGDIRVDGKLAGSIECKNKLVVGVQGDVEGEITCKNADISGAIKANMNVEEMVTLKSTSKFIGDIKANKLAVEPGAIFSGKCEITGGIDIPEEEENEEESDS